MDISRTLQTRIFNAGNTRRKKLGAGQDAAFFDGSNPAGANLREEIAMQTLTELLEWLDGDGVC
jgi:hypothetical protein